jgi:hypothetical protein
MRRPTDVSDACFSEIKLGGNQDAEDTTYHVFMARAPQFGCPGYQRMRSQPHLHINSCTDEHTATNQHANSRADEHTAANRHANSRTDEHTTANQHAPGFAL